MKRTDKYTTDQLAKFHLRNFSTIKKVDFFKKVFPSLIFFLFIQNVIEVEKERGGKETTKSGAKD